MDNLENDVNEMLLTLTTDIVTAQVSNNSVQVSAVQELIAVVHQTLSELVNCKPLGDARPQPAVSVRASVKRDHIVCLEDGKKMKMLKRHLREDHGMTPDDYRRRWGLAADYPMVPPEYSERRRDLAVQIGLGRKNRKERA